MRDDEDDENSHMQEWVMTLDLTLTGTKRFSSISSGDLAFSSGNIKLSITLQKSTRGSRLTMASLQYQYGPKYHFQSQFADLSVGFDRSAADVSPTPGVGPLHVRC